MGRLGHLGLGAGAHSFSALPPGARWSNERCQRPRRRRPRAGHGGGAEERLNPAQARAEFCFCGLRQRAGLDVAAFRRRFGVPLDEAFPHVDRLVADGLLERAAERVRLTPRGFRFADTVAATFV